MRHSVLLRWIDPRFTHRPRIYITQSIMAALALGAVLLARDILTHGAIVAAAASSIAVVFFVPHSVASSPFRIVGGHISGVLAAYVTLGIALLVTNGVADSVWFTDVLGALSLGLVILIMTITNTEHAPAAGTALGLSLTKVPPDAVLFILAAAVIVAAIRVVFAKRLHNLI